jgi:hypothetical protein
MERKTATDTGGLRAESLSLVSFGRLEPELVVGVWLK